MDDAFLPVGSEKCPRHETELLPKSRQHFTAKVRYHVRRCTECDRDYLVAQPGPSGVTMLLNVSVGGGPPEDKDLEVGAMALEPRISIQTTLMAKLDRRLRELDRAGPDDLEQMQDAGATEWEAHAERLLLSYLWVLGAYEIIRTLTARASARTDVNNEIRESLSEAKRLFGRVRIPLAKAEPSRRHEETDSALAVPTLVPGLGVGWILSEELTVTRQELSEAFRKALRVLRDGARLLPTA